MAGFQLSINGRFWVSTEGDEAALAALSRVGKHIIGKRSGHHIPLDEPDLVVAARP